MLFWNSLAFSLIQWMLAIWPLVPLPFLKPAWTSGSSWFTYCWSLAWRIPWTEEPGGLQSMESQRVRHDWVTNNMIHHVNKLKVEIMYPFNRCRKSTCQIQHPCMIKTPSIVRVEGMCLIALLGTGMKTDLFQSLWPLLSFPDLLPYWVKHFNSIIF